MSGRANPFYSFLLTLIFVLHLLLCSEGNHSSSFSTTPFSLNDYCFALMRTYKNDGDGDDKRPIFENVEGGVVEQGTFFNYYLECMVRI